MADLTSVQSLLKEVWHDRLEVAFSEEIVGLQRIQSSSEGVRSDISGRYTVVPMRVGRNEGLGSRLEREVLPLPGQQQYVAARVELTKQVGVGDISAEALKLADREPRSFINTIDRELEGLKDDLMYDYARQFYGDGTGTMATVVAVNGNDIEVDNWQYLGEDARLDSVTPGTGVITASFRTITAINEADDEITLDDGAGVLVGDVLVRSGSYDKEINGLGIGLAQGVALQNIDPAVVRRWDPVVVTGAARAYNELEIIQALDSTRRRAGKQATVMFTGFGVRRAIFSSLVANREFHNTVEFGHGFSALPFNLGAKTVPIVEDPHFPEAFGAATGSIYGVCEEDVAIYRHEDGWHFADETGSIFLQATNRSDAWEFRVRQFSQMGYHQRNSHFTIENINTA